MTAAAIGRRSPALGRGFARFRRSPNRAAHLAAAASAGFGIAGTLWALGAPGFPFGVGDPEAADMNSLLVGAQPGATGAGIALLGLCGTGLALAAARRPGGRARTVVLVAAWAFCLGLLLAVPDVRLMRDFAYAFMLHFDKLDWPTAVQVACVAWALTWGATALELRRRPGAEAAEGRDWARISALATSAAVLLPLPYELIRWAWAFGLPLGVETGARSIEQASAQARLGMFVLGLLPLLGGLLVHWMGRGARIPSWSPVRPGRAVPVALVVVPATLVAVMIITAGLSLLRGELNVGLGRVPEPHPDVTGWGAWFPGVFWLPWGLALAAATCAYYVRATRRPRARGRTRAARTGA